MPARLGRSGTPEGEGPLPPGARNGPARAWSPPQQAAEAARAGWRSARWALGSNQPIRAQQSSAPSNRRQHPGHYGQRPRRGWPTAPGALGPWPSRAPGCPGAMPLARCARAFAAADGPGASASRPRPPAAIRELRGVKCTVETTRKGQRAGRGGGEGGEGRFRMRLRHSRARKEHPTSRVAAGRYWCGPPWRRHGLQGLLGLPGLQRQRLVFVSSLFMPLLASCRCRIGFMIVEVGRRQTELAAYVPFIPC